jgi:hypothetical protein
MKIYLFGVVMLSSACTLFLGAQKSPGCNDGIRDPGELCFQTEIFPVSQNFTEYPVFADLDADGLPDVAVGGALGLISLFFQNEAGDFTEVTTSANPGEFINSIIAADFDQDGRLDLATANSSSFSVLLNQGGRSFITTNNPGCLNDAGVSACSATNWIEAKDLNADGSIDLLIVDENFDDPVAGPNQGVALWFNDGEGVFSFQENLDFGNNEQAVYVTDLDKNGKVEVLGVVGEGFLALTESDGAGLFTAPAQIFPTRFSPKTATVADFNQDAAVDVVSANNDGSVSLFLNPNDRTLNLISSGSFFIGGGARSVVSADLEGDGDLDLIVTNDADDIGLSFLANDGDGNFSPLFTENSFDRIFGLNTGDLNLDGLPDFVLSANDFGDDDEAVVVFLLSAP